MQKNLKELFKNAQYQPDPGFSADIYRAISLKEVHKERISSYLYMGLGASALTAFVFVALNLVQEFARSGFYEYISLAFSDSGVIASHWKEFALSLADSLPTMSLVLSLSLVFVVCLSLRRMAGHVRNRLSIA